MLLFPVMGKSFILISACVLILFVDTTQCRTTGRRSKENSGSVYDFEKPH